MWKFLRKDGDQPLRTRDKVIAGILVLVFLCIFYVTLDANKYRAQVHVIEGEGKVGINPTTESLDFGDLSKGTSAVRTVTIKNGTPIPMFIAVFKVGSIADLIDLNKNYFSLSPHSEAKIEFTVFMPASGEVGKTYTGRVFLFKVPGI